MSAVAGRFSRCFIARPRLIPAVALGLYFGRVISEQVKRGWAGAVLITALALLISALLLRLTPVRSIWPISLLLIYVVYPEPFPGVAISIAGLTLMAVLQTIPVPRLSTPVASKVVHVTAMLLVTGGFLLLYVATLAQDVLPADSGEFQLVATNLGVAHPPGFPLYTMLAHLATRLPLGPSPAYRVNLFSALTSALTLLVVYLSVRRLSGSILAGVLAAAALGTATTFWAQATTANIRSLTALFAALALYGILRPGAAGAGTDETAGANAATLNARRDLALFVLPLTLGITHHGSLVFMGVVVIMVAILERPQWFTMPRRWLGMVLLGLVGALPWIYLIWRGLAGAWGAPADLTTARGFLNHVLALGFRGDLFHFTQPSVFLERFKVMGSVLLFQFEPALLAAMALGFAFLLVRRPRSALLVGGSFAVHTLVTATYRAPQTVEYMLPAYVPAVIALGYLLGTLREWQTASRAHYLSHSVTGAICRLIIAVLVAIVFRQGLQNLPSYRTLHDQTDARSYAQPLLEEGPQGSSLLTDWHWATPLWYLQHVEGLRPDLETRFVFPTDEPYAETWARRIGEELDKGRPVIATHFNEEAYAALPAPEPLGEAFLFPQERRTALPPGYQALDLNLGDQVRITGFRLETAEVPIGQEVALLVSWEAQDLGERPISLFAHMVGADGQLYAQDDVPAQDQSGDLVLTRFRLTPRLGARPGVYSVMVGAYGTEALLDDSGQARSEITALRVVPMAAPPVTLHRTYRTLVNRPLQRLVGYDWDRTLPGQTRLYLHWQTDKGYQTEMRDVTENSYELAEWFGPWGIARTGELRVPATEKHYVPFGHGIVWTGQSLSALEGSLDEQVLRLPQTFKSGQPVTRDLIVSLRLVGYEEDGASWNWWDLDNSVPAMGAIPTLKWIRGSRIRDPHMLTVARSARAGQSIGVLLGMYDAFTGRQLPILDERISQATPWVPLGRAVYEPTSK